jgi:hypothetical protein
MDCNYNPYMHILLSHDNATQLDWFYGSLHASPSPPLCFRRVTRAVAVGHWAKLPRTSLGNMTRLLLHLLSLRRPHRFWWWVNAFTGAMCASAGLWIVLSEAHAAAVAKAPGSSIYLHVGSDEMAWLEGLWFLVRPNPNLLHHDPR